MQVVVILRTLLQDRMAALNGRTVKHVLQQDQAAFIRLIGLSTLQVMQSQLPCDSLFNLLCLGFSARGGGRMGKRCSYQACVAVSRSMIGCACSSCPIKAECWGFASCTSSPSSGTHVSSRLSVSRTTTAVISC